MERALEKETIIPHAEEPNMDTPNALDPPQLDEAPDTGVSKSYTVSNQVADAPGSKTRSGRIFKCTTCEPLH